LSSDLGQGDRKLQPKEGLFMSEPQKTVETRGDDRVDLLTADTNFPAPPRRSRTSRPLLADQGLLGVV
jgi:hypothetical protein